MNPPYYQLLHVFSLLVLTAQTYMALANPNPANRKQTLIITGVATLVMLISGFGLIAKSHGGQFHPWMFVKLACWLVFSAIAGLAYRKVHLRGLLSAVGLVCLLVALFTVYIGRF